jgi:hypothetical protein
MWIVVEKRDDLACRVAHARVSSAGETTSLLGGDDPYFGHPANRSVEQGGVVIDHDRHLMRRGSYCGGDATASTSASQH